MQMLIGLALAAGMAAGQAEEVWTSVGSQDNVFVAAALHERTGPISSMSLARVLRSPTQPEQSIVIIEYLTVYCDERYYQVRARRTYSAAGQLLHADEQGEWDFRAVPSGSPERSAFSMACGASGPGRAWPSIEAFVAAAQGGEAG